LVTLIGYGGPPAGGDIAVALDAPWPLARSAAPTKIALYGRTPGAFTALLAVLAGKAAATGKLPAAVGTYRPGSGCR
jgi:beta-N-acetylhexosaminidase